MFTSGAYLGRSLAGREQRQQHLTETEETYFERQLSLDEAESNVKKYCTRNVRREKRS